MVKPCTKADGSQFTVYLSRIAYFKKFFTVIFTSISILTEYNAPMTEYT